jgi:hypothetical protein
VRARRAPAAPIAQPSFSTKSPGAFYFVMAKPPFNVNGIPKPDNGNYL